MDEAPSWQGAVVPLADQTRVASGLNPLPELLPVQQLRAVAGGLNPQPLPPAARFRA